jgi:hypothetical protein
MNGLAVLCSALDTFLEVFRALFWLAGARAGAQQPLLCSSRLSNLTVHAFALQ